MVEDVFCGMLSFGIVFNFEVLLDFVWIMVNVEYVKL